MTHSYVWHDSVICMTWLIHVCDMTHTYVWHDSFICVTWNIHMCDMTHSSVWHDSFVQVTQVTWLICMCDMTHSYVWHDSFIYVTWLISWLIPCRIERVTLEHHVQHLHTCTIIQPAFRPWPPLSPPQLDMCLCVCDTRATRGVLGGGFVCVYMAGWREVCVSVCLSLFLSFALFRWLSLSLSRCLGSGNRSGDKEPNIGIVTRVGVVC